MLTVARSLKLTLCTSAFAILTTSLLAQHAHKHSPYAHTQSAEVPSLTPEEVRELRLGEGMGLARAAELNHFPGPKHLLDLASDLGLSDEQILRIEEIHRTMKSLAVSKGKEILRQELHLSHLFASGNPSAAKITNATEHLGILRGQLQAIHLLAHLESALELTGEQIDGYDRLRGYVH